MTPRDLIIFAIGSTTGAVLLVALQLASAPLARFRRALARRLLPAGPGHHVGGRRHRATRPAHHQPRRHARPAMTSR